jgi:hypothetical protein
MGSYIYTLRKASRNIITKKGKSKVYHFSYAFKPSSMWGNNRAEASLIRRGKKAFEDYDKNDFIVIKDVKDDNGRAVDLDYEPVYNNLSSGTLYDNDMHSKMTAVGYLLKKGKQYELIESQSTFENDKIKIIATVIPRWSNDCDSVIYEWEWKNQPFFSEKGYKVLVFDSNSIYANTIDYSDIAEKIWKNQQKTLLSNKKK